MLGLRSLHRDVCELPGGVCDKSAGLAGVSSGLGLDDGLLVCTLLLLI